MGEARWLPLFVTADVSLDVCINFFDGSLYSLRLFVLTSRLCDKVINSVLRSAAAEKEEDESFENRWVVVQYPDQHMITKPSTCPVDKTFQSGFLGASIQVLQYFVTSRCGEDGLGHDGGGVYMDWLADDAFGAIDGRTAEDNTILFCVREIVDAVQEAEVRVAQDKGLSVHI